MQRIALVTGGMGGIGTAICQTLFQKNIRVVAGYSRKEEAAKAWQNKQKEAGFTFEIAYADVANFDSCDTMVKKIKQEVGPIDILVNNAGITHDAICDRMTKEDWDSVIQIDLNSVFYVTHAVIHDMIERKYGRIVNISSINGQKGAYGQVNYAAAKAGIHGFTKALALEVAKAGITVNTVSPGYVETEMVHAMRNEIREKIISQIPMKRFATSDEIAYVVVSLIDEKNTYMTGANIAINGGYYMV